jgi:hypothetical protein
VKSGFVTTLEIKAVHREIELDDELIAFGVDFIGNLSSTEE